MVAHIVQSKEWGDAKAKNGTPAYRVGSTQYTLHKIPFTHYFVANSPKVNPFEIDWDAVKKSALDNNAFAVNFDVPNVIKDTDEGRKAEEIFQARCIKSPRDTFAKANVLLDLTQSEGELLANMHKKHRYNIGVAQKGGVTVRRAQNTADFDSFYRLLKTTADRQKYYVRAKEYYQIIWDTLAPKGISHILIAEKSGSPLAAWMLFCYENILYYPYGGSSDTEKNLFASNLLGWEAIRFGKQQGCRTFDMWGAAVDPNNKKDTYYGFTTFKLKFGGQHVLYIDSYDLVINKPVYDAYNAAQHVRWKLLNAIK